MQFKLRNLLIIIALFAVVLAVGLQMLYTVGRAEIVENQLFVDERGFVEGTISWTYSKGPDEFLYCCDIQNLKNEKIVSLKPGSKFDFQYRSADLPFWPKEDPHRQMMWQTLGIDGDQVVGYVTMSEHVSIVVDGNTE